MTIEAAIHDKAIQFCGDAVEMCAAAGSGHPTTAMSISHITAVLTHHAMRWVPSEPWHPGSDRLVLSEGQNTFGIRGSQGMSALTVNNGASDLLSIERTTGGASISSSLLIGNGSDAASMSLISKSQPTSMNVEGSLAHTTVVASSGQIARVDMKEGSAPGDAFSLSYNDTVVTLSLRRGAMDHLMQARVRR